MKNPFSLLFTLFLASALLALLNARRLERIWKKRFRLHPRDDYEELETDGANAVFAGVDSGVEEVIAAIHDNQQSSSVDS